MSLTCNSCKSKFDRKDIIYAPKVKAWHYWCDSCYKDSKYYNEEKYEEYLEKTKERFESQNIATQYSADLCKWFAKNVGFLDIRFYMKKADINKGKFGTKQFPLSPVSHKISDEELYDMCLMMEKHIRKQVANLKKKEHVVHYVLAMLYNSYPKYLSYKEKQPKTEDVKVVESVSSIIEKRAGEVDSKKDDKINLDSFLI